MITERTTEAKPHLYTSRHTFKLTGSLIKNHIPSNHSAEFRVLDVPAGGGRLTQFLVEECKVNVSASDYDITKWDYDRVQCVQADLSERLPYPDGSFDLVVCLEGIKHIPNVQRGLKELWRVLKPEGILILTVPNDLNLQSRLRYLFDGFVDVDWKMPMSLQHENERKFLHLGTQLSLPYLWYFLTKAKFSILYTKADRLRFWAVLIAVLLYPVVVVMSFKAAKSDMALFRELVSLRWLAGRRNAIVCRKN